jgi:hypothetical protein
MSQKLLAAPAVARLEDLHLKSPRYQLQPDAAKKMRIAVVPIGNQRVTEDYEPQA